TTSVGSVYLTSFPTRRSSDLEVLYRLSYSSVLGDTSDIITHFGKNAIQNFIFLKKLRGRHEYKGREQKTAGEVFRRRRDPSLYRSEEHTSELQSRFDLVCRLL